MAAKARSPLRCSCGLELCGAVYGNAPPGACARLELLAELAGQRPLPTWSTLIEVLEFRSLDPGTDRTSPLFRGDAAAAASFFEGLNVHAKSLEQVGGLAQVLRALVLRVLQGFEPAQAAGFMLDLLPPWLREQRTVALAAVRLRGQNLRAVGPSLRADPAIICAAVAQDPQAYEQLSPRAKLNPLLQLQLRELLPPEQRNATLRHLSLETCCAAGSLPPGAEPLAFDGAELLCPVCLQDFFLCPGVPKQCREGHLLCAGCLEQLGARAGRRAEVSCPTCRLRLRPEHFSTARLLHAALQRARRACPLRCNAVLNGQAAALDHVQERCPARPVTCPVCPATAAPLQARFLHGHLRSHCTPGGAWQFSCRTAWRLHQPLHPIVCGADDDCVLLRSYTRRGSLTQLSLECLQCDSAGGLMLTAGTGFSEGNIDYGAEVRAHLVAGQRVTLQLSWQQEPPTHVAAFVKLSVQRKRSGAARAEVFDC